MRRTTGLKITVIGMGYVGAVAAACLADRGHEVTGVDIDAGRVELLRRGKAPFFEPELEQLVQCSVRQERLRFAQPEDFAEPLGDVALIAVGTPAAKGGGTDLAQVTSALDWVRSRWAGDTTVVMKSTVPPGTGRRWSEAERALSSIRYASNPEFLREGRAVQDWRNPDRIVIGVEPGDLRSAEVVRAMHAGTAARCMVTDITSAEMLKYASNALLATRISFINEMAMLCERTGASIDVVSEGLAMDPRLGSRIYAGVGYGGSCFPKDVGALNMGALNDPASWGEAGLELLRAVVAVNRRQRLLPFHALLREFHGKVAGLRVAVLGLAFKPDTDDVREAPALDLIRTMADAGVEVSAYDPWANEAAHPHLPAEVHLAGDPVEAARGTYAVVLMTEWEQITGADWEAIAHGMLPPRYVFDGRNALDPVGMRELGFEYVGIGRSDAGSVVTASSLSEKHDGEWLGV